MGFYFIKDMKVHKYPVPSKCEEEYNGEKLYGAIPEGSYVKCNKCFDLEDLRKKKFNLNSFF